jgi:dihydrodipicolinate synthase/N-acetylneuraminate lyase
LVRYYLAAGVGGLAVGVHTTQFAIRGPRVQLFRPVLELASEALLLKPSRTSSGALGIAGACGKTSQAVAEASLARELGYSAILLSLGALKDESEDQLLCHCREVSQVLPLFGFYLQPAVGGRVLPYTFWRRLAEMENLVAIKMAPFNRYQTLDVVRAVAEAGREDVALYTGNDDSIVTDLITPFRFQVGGRQVERRIVGGLLGHWAVWTRKAVEIQARCRSYACGDTKDAELLAIAAQVTDMNAAVFDAANQFKGCIPGIHEVLWRQGLLEGTWCLDPEENLSPGQAAEIARVYRAYPHLTDDDFVRDHLAEWMR